MRARASRLYRGLVVHTRLRPRRHRLAKRIPMVLVDLDEAADLDRELKLFRINRSGLLSLEARHHLSGEALPLKPQVQQRLASEGIEAHGPVRLLCMPAVFGQVFNPLSIYLCHAAGGGLSAIIYEVNNTFGGRHCYVLPVATDDGPVRHGCAKTFHVSPFMDMDLEYAFTVNQSEEHVAIGIQASDGAGPILAASFVGEGEPLTDRALFTVLLQHPLLMWEVLAAIHWEAFKLLAKGLRLRPAKARTSSPAQQPGR